MEDNVEEKYMKELITLKINSKPLINSLTMMAEDFIQSAVIVVQVIEKHLTRVKPEGKLPILYLVDSIVKNIKKEYVELFTQNIVSTFCGVFEQVDERTRGYLWKLRQTWVDVFPPKKLMALDMRCNDIDEKWPIGVGVAGNSATIHLNPKFLSSSQQYPAITIPGNTIMPSPYDTTDMGRAVPEAQMREQLLIKQKQLLELQTKKLELELLQTQAKLDEQSRLKFQGEQQQAKLLAQAELAKQKTQEAASIMARANANPPPPVVDLRFDNGIEKKPAKPKNDNTTSDRKRDREEEKNHVKKEKSSKNEKVGKSRTDERKTERERGREKIEISSKLEKLGKSRSDGRKPERERDREQSESSSKNGKSGKSRSNNDRKAERERDREKFKSRTNAVLSRNYRKRSGIEDVEEEGLKLKINPPIDGDVDRRFDGGNKKDVTQRKTSTPNVETSESTSQPPAPKKSKASSIIDNLFGREDVDLRQSSSSWSQMKRPSSAGSDVRDSGPEDGLLRRCSDATDDEVKEMIRDGKHRPPPPLSPASSVGSTAPSTTDALGRPLAFARLPDDPDERRRSLGSRSASVDPLETFRFRYIETPLKVKGVLDSTDLEVALSRCKEELDQGILNNAQFNIISKQLVQLNEGIKIRKVQEMDKTTRPIANNSPNPWNPDANPVWAMPVPGFPGSIRPPRVVGRPDDAVWAAGLPIPVPRGPNPFVEVVPSVPEMSIPVANQRELSVLEADLDASIPLDKIQRQVRFYGNTSIVFVGKFNDEPRELSFRPEKDPRTVCINKEPIKVRWGIQRKFYYGANSHSIRIGAPTRELYIDGIGYEVFFGGTSTRIQVDNEWVNFKLPGPPPSVDIGRVLRYDLVAGRTTVFVDGNPYQLFLDEKPQILDFVGFPVIAKFGDEFRSITFNGTAFATNFGGPPRPVTLPSGRRLYIRFNAISPVTEQNIMAHIRTRLPPQQLVIVDGTVQDEFFTDTDTENMPGFCQNSFPNLPNRQELPISANPLDMVANLLPVTETTEARTHENSYEIDESVKSGDNVVTSVVEGEESSSGPLNVQDLLSKLMLAGLLPAGGQPTTKKEEPPLPNKISTKVEKPPKVKEKVKDEQPQVLPLVEFINLRLSDNLKQRRPKLIDILYTGIQCASCGLRFPSDQNYRYTQHLDWHFRQNRREKANSRKALSRKWYFDLSDWIQFEEVEDLEGRATSLFESQDLDMDADHAGGARILDPDSYTVLAIGYEGTVCPQCGEGFETFFDEEKEEWRVRDAMQEPEMDQGSKKLFHPICYQDYQRALVEEEVIETPVKPTTGDDDDEIQIIRSGPKEIVLMELDIAEDDEKIEEEEKIIDVTDSPKVSPESMGMIGGEDLGETTGTKFRTSYTILSPLLIDVAEDDDNSNIPGIARNSGTGLEGNIFGFALNSISSQTGPPATEESRPIIYESMKFDFPKIKVEPIEWQDIPEDQIIMSSLFTHMNSGAETMDITLDDEDSGIETPRSSLDTQTNSQPSSRIPDIDLTGEDEIDPSPMPPRPIVAEMDGNLQFRVTALAPAVPTKIKINIAGLDTSSQSPTHKGSEDLLQSTGVILKTIPTSPKKNPQSPSSGPDLEILFKTDEIKRLKPRLYGKKLVNNPPKMTGKEESGLCSIM